MNALEIIRRRANPEGFNVPQEVLGRMATAQVQAGYAYILECEPLVFTVAKNLERPTVHMYGEGAAHLILSAVTQFMQRVWKETPHTFLLAPILNETVVKLAKRAGWKKIRRERTGHLLYRIERPL